ncbi:DUF6773 family protein [Gracilibacillus sp. JCM 18860]|uniref:DUF6773 family protein n=1 Tax=Gracilibacillus sp. JCM 18860 TaxID=1306159 RepID=UPI00326041F1
MLFRKKRYQDERVTAEQNRIYREIYILIYVICFLSIVYKFIMNGGDFIKSCRNGDVNRIS